ncbi:MAG: transcriptional regulator, partial [Deltaproteobacteria bacterium]
MTHEHPSPDALEAFHVGDEADTSIAAHVAGCDACRAWVDGLAERRRALLEREAPDVFARR